MKIPSIEYKIKEVDWSKEQKLLAKESHHIYHLYGSDALSEIYFTENKTALLVMEMSNQSAAVQAPDTLPLVPSGSIKFEVMALRP